MNDYDRDEQEQLKTKKELNYLITVEDEKVKKAEEELKIAKLKKNIVESEVALFKLKKLGYDNAKPEKTLNEKLIDLRKELVEYRRKTGIPDNVPATDY